MRIGADLCLGRQVQRILDLGNQVFTSKDAGISEDREFAGRRVGASLGHGDIPRIRIHEAPSPYADIVSTYHCGSGDE
jgi:hypothetical protein